MNVIIVFPKKEFALKINNILTKNGFHVVAVCSTGAKALQAIERYEVGIVISGIRYVDMMYRDLRTELPPHFEMILIASPGQWEEYGGDGVTYLPAPFKAYELVELVGDFSWDLERRLKKSKNKPKARSKREQGLIQEAKDRMMEARNWTEDEAHRYLQKTSMDSGRSLVETAAIILEIF